MGQIALQQPVKQVSYAQCLRTTSSNSQRKAIETDHESRKSVQWAHLLWQLNTHIESLQLYLRTRLIHIYTHTHTYPKTWKNKFNPTTTRVMIELKTW
jgi:hypothetical protein